MKYRFGEKIRGIREKKALTMKELAGKIGVSESLISQIERNKVSPAIDTLLKIADVLEIDLEYLFADYKRTKTVNIVRKGERNKIILESTIYEQLTTTVGSNDEHAIEAFTIEIPPGQDKGTLEYGHQGKELGVILSGKGELKYGKEVYYINEGDSISFSSDIPHVLKNISSEPLVAFWVISPPKLFFKQV
ncbi:MAG: XRE family transcriptional regulator [Spirochaetes bacterium]|nr:XRE family transcriptional regulator [Spirochaetota bacterium]